MVRNQKQYHKWKTFHRKCCICNKKLIQHPKYEYLVFTSTKDGSWFVAHRECYENDEEEIV